MPKLKNQKHERFCQEYVQHGNGTKAAIDAGYAKKNADVTASKLLRISNVIERLREFNEIIMKKSIVTAVEVKKFLSDALEVDPLEFFEVNEKDEIVVKRLDKIKPEFRRLITGINFNKITQGVNIKSTNLKIEIPNKTKIADMLSRVFSIYNDKLTLTKKVSLNDMERAGKNYDDEYGEE